jgi:hypothetical protein
MASRPGSIAASADLPRRAGGKLALTADRREGASAVALRTGGAALIAHDHAAGTGSATIDA